MSMTSYFREIQTELESAEAEIAALKAENLKLRKERDDSAVGLTELHLKFTRLERNYCALYSQVQSLQDQTLTPFWEVRT